MSLRSAGRSLVDGRFSADAVLLELFMEVNVTSLLNMSIELGKCYPIFIVDEPNNDGARFGGKPPLGVKPAHADKFTEYFLTLPWDNEQEVSIFFSFSPADPVRSSWANARKVHDARSSLIEVVLHPKAPRASSDRLASSLLPRNLRIEAPIHDVYRGEAFLRYPYHKLGGRPFFRDAGSPGYESTGQLITEGYSHILQMSFPTDHDAKIGGSWPFGEMEFHMFAIKQGKKTHFRCYWA